MAASLVEVLLGGTGMIGVLIRFIGPISIAVTITTLGLSLVPLTIAFSSVYWPIAIAYVHFDFLSIFGRFFLFFSFFLKYLFISFISTIAIYFLQKRQISEN